MGHKVPNIKFMTGSEKVEVRAQIFKYEHEYGKTYLFISKYYA